MKIMSTVSSAAVRSFIPRMSVRQCVGDCLIGIVLLTIVAQHTIWTSQHQVLPPFSYVFEEPHNILDAIYNMDSTWNQSALAMAGRKVDGDLGPLSHLLNGLTQPTRLCRKMVQLGGHHCRGLPDGGKKVCLDSVIYPGRDYCLVYSFGVGSDFSFDWAMLDFGCQVYAFDQDKFHNRYPRNFGGVNLVKIRLGKSRLVSHTLHEDGSWFKYIYRPLDDIHRALRNSNVTLDYLKMDIEGDEWDVFTESVFKTDILQLTKQLALEFHLNDLSSTKNKTKEQRQQGIDRYQSVIDGLHRNGFELVWFEPNFKMPGTSTISNRTFHLYGEMLWVNEKWKKPQVTPMRYEKQISHGITRRKLKEVDLGWSWPELSL